MLLWIFQSLPCCWLSYTLSCPQVHTCSLWNANCTSNNLSLFPSHCNGMLNLILLAMSEGFKTVSGCHWQQLLGANLWVNNHNCEQDLEVKVASVATPDLLDMNGYNLALPWVFTHEWSVGKRHAWIVSCATCLKKDKDHLKPPMALYIMIVFGHETAVSGSLEFLLAIITMPTTWSTS